MRCAGAYPHLILVCLLAVMGCGGGEQVETVADGSAPDETPVKILPKWKLPGDYRIPGKADSYDDYRKAQPEWYALTVPPNKSGFRVATEWQEMTGVLLGFPGSQGSAVNKTMAQMVVNGVDYADWYVVVPNASAETTFVNLLESNGLSQAKIDAKVRFLRFSLDSIWMIDYGPFTLVEPDGSVAFVDFRYYHERVYDDAIPTKLGTALGVTTYRAGLDFEGGNFQMDEVGTCYHSQGLYWANPDKTQQQIRQILTQYLGCKTFIVLAPLEDGTTHIDMFSKLVSKNVFVLGRATSQTAKTTTINTLNQNNSILEAAVLADGSKLTIHRIPMPYQKDYVWRTYTNSTLVNGVNLWPIYSINKDLEAQALAVWQTALPGWSHVGINSDSVITWGGAMHCLSRTLPAGTYSKWVEDGTCLGGTCQAPAGGYDGSCTTDASCVGPKWLCPLPDCGPMSCIPNCAGKVCGDDGCGGSCGTCPAGQTCQAGRCVQGTEYPNQCLGFEEPSASSCTFIQTYEGCCDAKGRVVWCEDGFLFCIDCEKVNPACGWDFEGYYNCGTGGQADPSGQHPKACPATCTPSCAGKVCGDDGCGGSCGTCPAGQMCQAGQCVGCIPSCAGKACGDDGCGGSCGTCQSGYTCQNYQCVQQTDPCGGITIEGCCDGNVNWWCEDGQLHSEDCSKTNPPSKCGWFVPGGQYVSGYYCGGSGADPSGKFPIACPTQCTPDCAGKICGDDGCGGSCGTCPAGQMCQAGQCVGCIPSCTGKVCGDDGCGGSCGTCAEGETCQAGECVPIRAPDTYKPDTSCTPDCTGRQCGPDGCGGSCGQCPLGFICTTEGQCVAQTTPDTFGGDVAMADVDGRDVLNADPGTGGGKSGGGCKSSRGGGSWTVGLVLLGIMPLGLRRRANKA